MFRLRKHELAGAVAKYIKTEMQVEQHAAAASSLAGSQHRCQRQGLSSG